MSFLVLKAYLKLIYFDLYLARGNFSALYDKVPQVSDRQRKRSPRIPPKRSALPWTWLVSGIGKRRCALQRSAATACLLRRYGIPARMVMCAADAVKAQRLGRREAVWSTTNHTPRK